MPFIHALVFAVCLGAVVNYLVDCKLSKRYLKHGLLALAVGTLGVILQLLTLGEAIIVFLLVLCTCIIVEETRKNGSE
jgi:hypothetical protein